jgi:F0F1-type ATP synthase assembly protein I
MIENTKSRLPEPLRQELERGTESARSELDRRRDVARMELEVRTDEAKDRLGERLFDVGEEYFPEVARRRRQKVAAAAFAGGFVAGIAVRHVLGR